MFSYLSMVKDVKFPALPEFEVKLTDPDEGLPPASTIGPIVYVATQQSKTDRAQAEAELKESVSEALRNFKDNSRAFRLAGMKAELRGAGSFHVGQSSAARRDYEYEWGYNPFRTTLGQRPCLFGVLTSNGYGIQPIWGVAEILHKCATIFWENYLHICEPNSLLQDRMGEVLYSLIQEARAQLGSMDMDRLQVNPGSVLGLRSIALSFQGQRLFSGPNYKQFASAEQPINVVYDPSGIVGLFMGAEDAAELYALFPTLFKNPPFHGVKVLPELSLCTASID